jgi:hypothetical protein
MAEKEYIEREAAIEYARLLYCKDCNSYNGVRCRACAFDDVMLLIEDVPTADVVEVVRCKDCAYANEDGTRCHYGVGRDTEPMGYCHCGAKMDGKGEG